MEETPGNDAFIPVEPKGLILLADAQKYLYKSGKWARFLGIMGFIGSGFVALCGLFFGAIMSSLSRLSPMGTPKSLFSGAMGFFYILIAIFYFFLSLYLFQFGTRIKTGIILGDSTEVSIGLGKLKSFFKMIGITTIVILVLYVLIFIGIIIAAAVGFSSVRPGY